MRAIAKIIGKSLKHYRFSTSITVLSLGLAVGLFFSVFAIRDQADRAFTGSGSGFDAVMGARGSQVQLVLNAIFHLQTSPGNIPWSLYEAVADEDGVQLAIPYALGDNYYNYRVIGTIEELFKEDQEIGYPGLKLATGKLFHSDRMEAVVGSFAASQLGLKPGDTFKPYHGLSFDPNTQHEEEYLITGILSPTNSPLDRIILIPIEGVFRMGGHVLRGAGEEFDASKSVDIPDKHKEVSAVLLKLSSPTTGFRLHQMINRQGKVATLAWPVGKVMGELFEKMGWMHKVLTLIAYLVLLVASASILASIYNTVEQRRRDIAILRALGARRMTIFWSLLGECAFIAIAGAAVGFLVYGFILQITALILKSQTGVVLYLFQWNPIFLWGTIITIGMGIIAGILPAQEAYDTDVVSQLRS